MAQFVIPSFPGTYLLGRIVMTAMTCSEVNGSIGLTATVQKFTDNMMTPAKSASIKNISMRDELTFIFISEHLHFFNIEAFISSIPIKKSG